MNTVVARAKEIYVPITYLNLVGGQDELLFDGGSFVLNKKGELACQMPMFVPAENYIDSLINQNQQMPRFIKTDTEGYDYFVIRGFGKYLKNVHAVRTEIHFQEVFKESPKFTDLFSLLSENGFRLANLDYEGSGVQQSYFVPNKRNYGICTGTEGVFIRSNEYYLNLYNMYPNSFYIIIYLLI